MKKALTKIALSLALLAPVQAHADVACIFTLDDVGVDTWGMVTVNVTNTAGEGKFWYVCSVAGAYTGINNGYSTGSISSDTCKVYFAQLITARASARAIGIWFKAPTSCAASALPANGHMQIGYPTNFVF